METVVKLKIFGDIFLFITINEPDGALMPINHILKVITFRFLNFSLSFFTSDKASVTHVGASKLSQN